MIELSLVIVAQNRIYVFWDEDNTPELEVLCRALDPVSWNTWNMAVLHAYFDASGHEEDQSHLVVAGFVSSVSDWLTFETAWRDRLREDDLPYFRAAEFAHRRGPFKGWEEDEPKRRRLSGDLMKIITASVFRKFGNGVSIANLKRNKASSDALEKWRINAYVLAARTSVADIARWVQGEKWTPRMGLVFEDGDLGRGDLSDLLSKQGYPRPLFGSKIDRMTPLGLQRGLVQLQAADWLAYETFQKAKRLLDPIVRDVKDRWAWTKFDAIPGVVGF